MVNVFTMLKPLVQLVMKLAGITPQKVEIEPGTVMNFWVPNNPTNKPPVVLLHGFFADGIFTWLFQVLALTSKYAVYVPDLLFFGDSTTDKPDRSTSFQAECLAKGLMKLGVERCTVIGFSYGGVVAFKLAKLHPDLVESMVVSGAVMELTESMSDRTLEQVGFSSWSEFLMPETVEGLKELISIGSHINLDTMFPRFVYRDFLQAMFHSRKERAELLDALIVPDDDLQPTIYSQRIYLLWGEKDEIFNLEALRDAAVQLGDRASSHFIENAGHIAQIDRPIIYNQNLKKILGSLWCKTE